MLESLGNHAQRQGLNPRDRLVAVNGVAHDAWKCRYLGKPTAVSFLFQLDGESHCFPQWLCASVCPDRQVERLRVKHCWRH